MLEKLPNNNNLGNITKIIDGKIGEINNKIQDKIEEIINPQVSQISNLPKFEELPDIIGQIIDGMNDSDDKTSDKDPVDGKISAQEVDIYAKGQEYIDGPYTVQASHPPKYLDRDGKVYDSAEQLKNARKEKYIEEHPEYKEASEKAEAILAERDAFIEEEMAKWDEENNYTEPPESPNMVACINPKKAEREAYLKALEEAYREENPSYAHLDNRIGHFKDPTIKINYA